MVSGVLWIRQGRLHEVVERGSHRPSDQHEHELFHSIFEGDLQVRSQYVLPFVVGQKLPHSPPLHGKQKAPLLLPHGAQPALHGKRQP